MPPDDDDIIWISNQYMLEPRFKYLVRAKGRLDWATHHTRARNECEFHKKIANWSLRENHMEFKPIGPIQ